MKKETKNKYWFTNKNYGWGWQPATKEGWMVILAYFVLVFAWISWYVPEKSPDVMTFMGGIAVLTIALILICWKTGEKPEWRWNGKPIFKK